MATERRAWDRPYRTELGTAAWKRTRARIRKRDGDRCYICGAHGIQVDHKVRGAGDHDGNLGVLCDAHHREKTQREAAEAMRDPSRRLKRPAEHHPGLIDPDGDRSECRPPTIQGGPARAPRAASMQLRQR